MFILNKINDLVSNAKNLYYDNHAKKLNSPLSQAKTYWSILKTFYNNKKIPLSLPLLTDDRFVTDKQAKANIFNKFFADQCTLLKNSSMVPTNQLLVTQVTLGSLYFNKGETLKIIRALNINKVHGHDDNSTRMIKICDEPVLKSLFILFKNSLKLSYYLDIWKKSNIIPVHKKNDKQLVNNY